LSESLRIDPLQEEIKTLLEKLDRLRNGHESRPRETAKRIRNVGFISIWFERGQSYVTKMLREVIAENHQTFVFARTGGVHGKPMLETTGEWSVPNLTTHGAYQIPHEVIKQWIEANDLDVVIFNEEYDWRLVNFCKRSGVKVATYLDYYKDDWKPYMKAYDAVLCSTKRTFNLVRNFCAAHYVGWAVDGRVFKPDAATSDKAVFFHNAGWLGINFRKMTPAAILAFDAVSRRFPECSLFVHAQCELAKLPSQVVEIVQRNPRIEYHVATVPAPGLYHKGRVLLFPTKLEGLGLPLLEGLACGLPAIATDAAPMNEFIRDGYNGLLVRVALRFTREDNIAFPEEVITVNDLVAKMSVLASHPERIDEMARNARAYAEAELDVKKFSERVNQIIDSI
jgi:glycosyltransferase involved in cell wall biosynthesis